MKLGYTIIYVADVEATVHFYRDAFDLPLAFMTNDKDYAQLDTGSTQLAFASERLAEASGVPFLKNDPDNEKAPGIEIALVANNVEAAYQAACDNDATPIKAPAKTQWGQWVAYVRDLNGVLVELCSEVEEST